MVVILLLVPSSSSSSLTTTTYTNSASISQPKYHVGYAHDRNYYRSYGSRPLTHHHHQSYVTTIPSIPPSSSSLNANNNNNNNHNYSREYVNHVTRINISNDFSQIEASNSDPEATVKEEEIITKRKTELTTTKQIETRVKRQVKFEDGKVIEDSGPIVSTATTEDTDKVESEQTERKTLGEPSNVIDTDNNRTGAALEFTKNKNAVNGESSQIAEKPSTVKKYALAATRDDGLVREEKNNRVVSREDTTELTEIEDVRHYGDFSDAAFVKAVNSGSENIEAILLSPESKLQLVPHGPKLVKQTVNKHTTVDTEDTELKCIRQSDGTLVTEKKKTTEHEDIIDKDLPDGDNQSSGSQEKILKHKESSQRFVKERDEQEVEYVSDGKVIAKEMRYAKENEFMERDGSKEDDTDWDSLSDRVKKSRRQLQKALQRENAERKDALTNRPLDFDREEETRRKETYKWLDNHFGSESTSKESRDDSFSDIAVEPTKKTYFNVTIKSNNHNNVANTSSSSSITNNNNNNNNTTTSKITNSAHNRQSNSALLKDNDLFTNKLSAPSKVYVPDREPATTSKIQTTTAATLQSNNKKYFQGISDWSERKEPSTPRPVKAHPLSTKAFQDELSGTLERKQHMMKLTSPNDNNNKHAMAQTSGNGIKINDQKVMKYKSSSRDDILKTQKIEDLGYLSGSRTDLRVPRKYTNDDYAVPIKKKISTTNGYLHREDSGFRDSKEDLRLQANREDSFGHEDVKQTSIQRDDSAYVSSSTYFTTPRSPRRPRSPVIVKTPDSGIRSPTPTNDFESDELNQSPPAVPQRKKAIDRKMRVPIKNGVDYANSPAKPRRDPPIDYSPPPRSRSASPLPPIHHVYSDRKSYQKTRFSSPPSVSRSMQTQTSPAKKKSVGNAIGNSIRKLVGKIRSASAERKLKAKSPPISSSSKHSPSPLPMIRHKSVSNLPLSSSSYQRNNDYIIDSHITNGYKRAPSTSTQASTNTRRERTVERNERSGSSTDNEMPASSDLRTVTTHHQKKTVITSPKQRYYLGENPYTGSLFGKENKYIVNGSSSTTPRESEIVKEKNYYNNNSSIHAPARRLRSEEPTAGSNSTTLGRYSKSTNRLTSSGLTTSTPVSKNGFTSSALNESNENYRSSQTLPRKLEHHKQNKPISQSTINVSIVNNVKNQPVQNTGPAKPARTYKALQRSKSFNVHGMNGTNDPSPIYMEKLTNNNYKNYPQQQQQHKEAAQPERIITTTTHHTSIYKSTPHLNGHMNQDIKLKSPSIVNLISRSTRDLSQLNGSDHQYIDRRYNSSPFHHDNNNVKKSTFLRGNIDDEMTTRNIKFAERDSSGSKASSRSSPTVGKDSPIGILRRSSNSTDNDNFCETYKYQTLSNDPVNPTVTDTVETFSKKIIPSNGQHVDPRTKKETVVERHEIKKVTTSRNFGSPSPTSLKYYDVNHNRNGNGGVVIELRNNY